MDAAPAIARRVEELPLGGLRDPLTAHGGHVVGGWVRELAAGRDPGGDVDIAVEGDLDALLDELDPSLEVEVHERHRRFGTATIAREGVRFDLSRTRRETYAHPGALPDVESAPIGEDLGRRDFTVNALAVPLARPGDLLDPHGGLEDLRRGTLRVLHDGSFEDDPTRAIRAARYASRLGLTPDEHTLELLARTDLGTVSSDRRFAELARLAAEPSAAEGFALLARWGVLDLSEAALEVLSAIDRLGGEGPWRRDPSTRSGAILLAATGGERAEAALSLAVAEPERPSEAVRLAAGHSDAELLIAAAGGAAWIDEYARTWRETSLEIGGEDLIAAGVPEGPAVGAALRATLARKLDGSLAGGRQAELDAALAFARESI